MVTFSLLFSSIFKFQDTWKFRIFLSLVSLKLMVKFQCPWRLLLKAVVSFYTIHNKSISGGIYPFRPFIYVIIYFKLN